MKKLKAGIIGTGMGRLHMENYSKDPRVQIFAICDINRSEAEEFAKKYKAKYIFTEYEKMLDVEEIDLVSIATPNYLHMPMSIAALERGKHVLCEKPMATNFKDAQAMVKVAEEAKKRLMIHMVMRFYPTSYTMRKFIDAGLLGKIYYAKSSWLRRRGTPLIDFPSTGIMGRGDWFVKREKSGGGVLMDIGTHMYDLAWWMMDCPEPVLVSASSYAEITPPRFEAKGIHIDVDELSSAFIKFDNNATIFLEISWESYMKPGTSLSLFGNKAGIRWNNWKEVRIFRDEENLPVTVIPELPQGENVESSYYYFVSAVLDPEMKMMASGEECLKAMKVLEAVKQSSEEKQPITFS